MADEGEAGGEGDAGASALAWTYKLMNLERFLADPEEEDGRDIFTAKFQIDGPNANAEVEIIVSDYEDEANVISIALHTLHGAMVEWGKLTEDRRIVARRRGKRS